MRCSKCDAPITKDTRFCAGCGDALPWTKAAGAGPRAAVLSSAVELDELTRLNAEKRRLSLKLEGLLQLAAERGSSPDEQREYEEIRAEWLRLQDVIATRMESLAGRPTGERRRTSLREHQRRQTERSVAPDRRSGDERRVDDRRTVSRRNPFPPAL